MTDDFDAAVLTARHDREIIPVKLRARQQPQWDQVATEAETGMRLIEGHLVLLQQPDAAELDRTYRQLKGLHGEAFGWDAPDVRGLERLGATRRRQYVRARINEWDLVRLDPSYQPATEVAHVGMSYAEQCALDTDGTLPIPDDG